MYEHIFQLACVPLYITSVSVWEKKISHQNLFKINAVGKDLSWFISAAYLSQYKLAKDSGNGKLCSLVLDTGYSFSHIVPYCKGQKMKDSVVR